MREVSYQSEDVHGRYSGWLDVLPRPHTHTHNTLCLVHNIQNQWKSYTWRD